MGILDFFDLKPLGAILRDLETPVSVIDVDILDANLKRWQARSDALGLANRPNAKTHKLAEVAKYQLALGASGISVQKLGEAEVVADARISDILVTFNIVGELKLVRLAALARRTAISVVADSEEVARGIGGAGLVAGCDIAVLVECDTGAGRNGLQSADAAVALAKFVDATPGIAYGGLMTYSAAGGRVKADAFLAGARDLATAAGLQTATVGIGGSPDMWKDEGLSSATEYRAGTYVHFDRSLIALGACSYADCVLSLLAAMVSRPAPERAIIDAGSKALTSGPLGLEGYRVVHSLGDAQVYNVNEEHGYLDLSRVDVRPSIGDLVAITPNHACPVSNLFDQVILVRGSEVLGRVGVDALGLVQ
ncbi:MAG: alanine racemase [Cucumibacter sp.]